MRIAQRDASRIFLALFLRAALHYPNAWNVLQQVEQSITKNVPSYIANSILNFLIDFVSCVLDSYFAERSKLPFEFVSSSNSISVD